MRVGSGHITDKEHETSSSFMLFCDARPETSSSIIYPVLKDMQTERHAMRRTAAFAADSFPLPACPPGAAALRSGPHVGKPRLPPKTSLKKKRPFSQVQPAFWRARIRHARLCPRGQPSFEKRPGMAYPCPFAGGNGFAPCSAQSHPVFPGRRAAHLG